jgi:hypothetical protein
MVACNIADPGSPELLTPEDFELTLIDRRAFHVPSYEDKDGKKIRYTPALRAGQKFTRATEAEIAAAWANTKGIILHQTACDMGENVPRYDTMGAHFGVLRSGNLIRLCDENREVFHAQRWNKQCVGIEFNGRFAGREDDPTTIPNEALASTWNDPTTPFRELPMQPTPQQLVRGRQLIRWICWNVKKHGGEIKVLGTHRQASMSRRNDPGECIWKPIGPVLHAELGLHDGGVGFVVGGLPIPECWDARCKGIPY